ncbi:MAG: hypothetical protein H3C47_01225 [Candidatus Cloacimonetes bacterium]|nr:hypothetical protein [Candidatus Cloacimonadota bacterium]
MVKCSLILFLLFCLPSMFASGFATYQAQAILDKHPALRNYDPLVQRIKKRVSVDKKTLQSLYQKEETLHRELMVSVTNQMHNLKNSLMDLKNAKEGLFSKSLADPMSHLQDIGRRQAALYPNYLKAVHSLYQKYQMDVDLALSPAFLSSLETQKILLQVKAEIVSIGLEVMDSLNYSALVPAGDFVDNCRPIRSLYPEKFRWEVILQSVLDNHSDLSGKDLQTFVQKSISCVKAPFGFEPQSLDISQQFMGSLADLTSEIINRLNLRYGKLRGEEQ